SGWNYSDEFHSGGIVRSYEPWTPDAAWVAINITTDSLSRVIVDEEGEDERVFDNITHLELECFAPTVLHISPFEDGRIRVEIITYSAVLKDNTGHLDYSPWYTILFGLTCVADIYAYQQHVRHFSDEERKEQGRDGLFSIAWKFTVVLFFPLSITANESQLVYGSSLIQLWIGEGDHPPLATGFPSIIILISLLCLPGILFTYRLNSLQGIRQAVGQAGAVILITLAFAYAPVFVRYSSIRRMLLPLVLVLFVLVPLFKYQSRGPSFTIRPEGSSRWSEAMPTAVILLALFIPHSLYLHLMPYYSNLQSLRGLMWDATLREWFWTDDYGVTQSDVTFSFQLAYDWQIPIWIVYGLRFLFAYGIIRYAQGRETNLRTITFGLLDILFPWALLEIVTIATTPVFPYPGALNLVIPLPIFFLIGLGFIQVATPLQRVEDLMESEPLKGKTDRMIGNVKSDEISISGLYVMLSRVRNFITDLFKRGKRSKND
ncbi:MAG: hypothetical protein ACFFD6_01830, partial [Candidatus Thorarchaeota archaeon]